MLDYAEMVGDGDTLAHITLFLKVKIPGNFIELINPMPQMWFHFHIVHSQVFNILSNNQNPPFRAKRAHKFISCLKQIFPPSPSWFLVQCSPQYQFNPKIDYLKKHYDFDEISRLYHSLGMHYEEGLFLLWKCFRIRSVIFQRQRNRQRNRAPDSKAKQNITKHSPTFEKLTLKTALHSLKKIHRFLPGKFNKSLIRLNY